MPLDANRRLDARIPAGPIEQKWEKHRFDLKLVNPANKRKYDDVKFRAITELSSADPDVYFPLAQFPTRNLNLLVSASADPTNLIGSLRREVLKIDPSLPGYDLMTIKQRFNGQTAQPRFNVLLLSFFAVVALLLATVGIYGVMSYSMARRTQEIGIRMALGAKAGDILWLIFSQTVKLTAIALTLGIIVAFSLKGVISSVLYNMAATDPVTFIFASVIMVATALIASLIPAFRAIRVDPVIALRKE
jgi:putative ABC transport system permease protein